MGQEVFPITKVMILPDGRMDSKKTARYLGLSPKTLAMLRCAGKGAPYVKRGRIFYFRANLDEWLRAGRVITSG
jgi:hypothetical protein